MQPVHSGGRHGNWAASVSFLCPMSPLHLSFPGFGFCMQIENPTLIEFRGSGPRPLGPFPTKSFRQEQKNNPNQDLIHTGTHRGWD